MSETRPIIVIKRKKGHSAHHGGAWKVAYADFVTAMMALFIVLWLMNSSKQLQVAVGGYFKDPTGTSKKVGTNMTGSGENIPITKNNIAQLKEQLQKAVHKMSDFEKLKNQITMTVTSEGLRIELMETEKGTFFDLGSSVPNGNGTQLLSTLAEQLGQFPNRISIEGHTDSQPFTGKKDYSNWELSVDRANSTRKLMQSKGVRGDQVVQIRGFADQRLKLPEHPEDPSNRRISVVVHFLDYDKSGPTPDGAKNSALPAMLGDAKPEVENKPEGDK